MKISFILVILSILLNINVAYSDNSGSLHISNSLQESVIANRGHIQYQNGMLREVWGTGAGQWINLSVVNNTLQESVIANRGHIQYQNGMLREVWGTRAGQWIKIRE